MTKDSKTNKAEKPSQVTDQHLISQLAAMLVTLESRKPSDSYTKIVGKITGAMQLLQKLS